MSDDKKELSVILPIIRKVMPSVIASQIVGVQPMMSPGGFWRAATYKVIEERKVADGKLYHVKIYQNPIIAWVEETFAEDDYGVIGDETGGDVYVLPEKIYAMLKLKFEE